MNFDTQELLLAAEVRRIALELRSHQRHIEWLNSPTASGKDAALLKMGWEQAWNNEHQLANFIAPAVQQLKDIALSTRSNLT